MADALARGKRLDQLRVESDIKGVKGEVEGMIGELLFTDVMKGVLCSDNDFAFTGKNKGLRAHQPGRAGGLRRPGPRPFLMAHFKGQIVLPDAGFYLRDCHVSLIRENRMIAGVNHLAQLPPKLRQSVLLIDDKEASGATMQDAETLAEYAGFVRTTQGFTDYVQDAVAQPQ